MARLVFFAILVASGVAYFAASAAPTEPVSNFSGIPKWPIGDPMGQVQILLDLFGLGSGKKDVQKRATRAVDDMDEMLLGQVGSDAATVPDNSLKGISPTDRVATDSDDSDWENTPLQSLSHRMAEILAVIERAEFLEALGSAKTLESPGFFPDY